MTSRSDIKAALDRVSPHIRRTPVLRLAADELPGGMALKLEFLQQTGSFKPRGAFNRLLTADIPTSGVVAASGGNHGAAVAYAARALGHKATIFVPEGTPATKSDRIAAYGATVVRVGADYAEAFAACQEARSQTGAMDVHAFDDPAVLAGQGGVALEFEAEAPELTHVLVAVGGGGLIGGAAAWYGRRTRVVGVEPATSACFHAARDAGRPVEVTVGGIAADSLGARQIGRLAFAALDEAGAESVLVTDESIQAAQAWLWDRLRVIAEPGGATALAAVLSRAWAPPAGSRVGIILCGANTDSGSVQRFT